MTGVLVSPTQVEGLYAILNHLAGESLMTHQLPRVSREAEPVLRKRYPTLAAIQIPKWEFGPGDDAKVIVMGWLESIAAEVGEWWEVQPLAAEDHTVIDPIAEIKMMRPDMPIIAMDL
jgi:hypothetical protein